MKTVNAAADFSAVAAYGPVAQLGERQVRNLEVEGSIPFGSTK